MQEALAPSLPGPLSQPWAAGAPALRTRPGRQLGRGELRTAGTPRPRPGCRHGTLAQHSPRLPPPRRHVSVAGSKHGSLPSRRPELAKDSSLAVAALPRLPHADSASSSSTSSSSLSGAPTTESDEDSELASEHGSRSSIFGSDADGIERRQLSAVKTTHKLRVGVLEGTTFLNEVRSMVGSLWTGSCVVMIVVQRGPSCVSSN